MPRIDYTSEDFPTGAPVANDQGTLTTTWDIILWAAITVGRPHRQYVFRHGQASGYEALFRLSLVRMAVEEAGPRAQRLERTSAARSLDPSEKGAVNYFLGMTMCKLFAASLLNTPWLLHLDVFRPALNPVLTGRSRPDFIGEMPTGQWLSFESKGRITPPDTRVKQRAKYQAERCVSVGGTAVTYHIGGITYFVKNTLRFYWCDPQPDAENAINLPFSDNLWRYYYRPALELIPPDQVSHATTLVNIPQADIQIAVYPDVLRFLLAEQWGAAKKWCIDHHEVLEQTHYRPDGIRVVAGASWSSPFVEPNV